MRIFTATVKSLMLGALMIGVSLLSPSCVDDNYNLDNICPEVTIGGEEVIVPLGTIDPVALSTLLGDELEGLDKENGVYVLKFEVYFVSLRPEYT